MIFLYFCPLPSSHPLPLPSSICSVHCLQLFPQPKSHFSALSAHGYHLSVALKRPPATGKPAARHTEEKQRWGRSCVDLYRFASLPQVGYSHPTHCLFYFYVMFEKDKREKWIKNHLKVISVLWMLKHQASVIQKNKKQHIASEDNSARECFL